MSQNILCIYGYSKKILKGSLGEIEIQKCIIHQIRNTTKFIPHKEKKSFCKDLKNIHPFFSHLHKTTYTPKHINTI